MSVAGLICPRQRGKPRRMYDSFDAISEDIDCRLADAADNRQSPMHTPVVATADADARVMVLRDWDAASRTLRFHTDARSPKVAVIGGGAPVGVLLYDKADKIHLRLRGTGGVERDGPVADAAWEASDNFARRCYLGEGPGAVSDEPTSGLPPEIEGIQPTDEQVVPGREHFAVLLVTVEEMDWFHLANTGHRRAVFAKGEWNWVSP